jgi:hypothetical protein
MGILDFLNRPTNSPYSEDMRMNAGMQSLGLLGGTMMAAGAPSTDPGQYGRIMAQGLAQAGPMMQQSLDQQMQMQDYQRQMEMREQLPGILSEAGLSDELAALAQYAPEEAISGLFGQQFASPDPLTDSMIGEYVTPDGQVVPLLHADALSQGYSPYEGSELQLQNKLALAEARRPSNTTIIEAEEAAQITAREIYGDPGPGLVWKTNPETGQVVIGENGAPIAVPYEGGSVWQEQQAAAAEAELAADKAETAENTEAVQYMVLQDDVARALALAQNESAVGFIGAKSAFIEGTPAYNLRQTLLGIEANIAFDSLNQMRAASETGGALGNVTERELALLAATYGSIDPNQSGSILQYNLKRLEWAMDKVINGMLDGSGGRRRVTQADFDAFTATLGGPDAPPVAASDKTDEELMRSLGIQ